MLGYIAVIGNDCYDYNANNHVYSDDAISVASLKRTKSVWEKRLKNGSISFLNWIEFEFDSETGKTTFTNIEFAKNPLKTKLELNKEAKPKPRKKKEPELVFTTTIEPVSFSTLTDAESLGGNTF